jgi:heme/copper-type cytochrome/quinol oxidase subunit 2
MHNPSLPEDLPMKRSVIALAFIFASSTFAKDIYFPIAGSTSSLGNFRTDVRIFNPSSSKDITISAFLLPVGNKNNTSVTSRSVTVPKRGVAVLNDVVTTLGGTDLNAIRLSSADDFAATERVYATQSASGACNVTGTLGQDVPPLDPAAAKTKGVLLQLKTTTQYRTNIGILNPNSSVANVTFKLYDKNNALVSTGTPIAVQPMGVVAPTNMVSGSFFAPGSADLSEAWVSYSSDQAVIVYASLVDNGTTDPTFIAMQEDTGTGAAPTGTTRTFTVTTRSWAIDISPAPSGANAINVGDTVVLNIVGRDTTHGFEIDDPNGVTLIALAGVTPGTTTTRQFTATKSGTYNYYCTVSSCGTVAGQHDNMFGQLIIGSASDGEPRPGY